MSEKTHPFGVPQFTSALSEVIKEQLVEDHSVHVPHLGTFDVSHKLSEIKELEQGVIEMTPPRTAVTFEPVESL